MGPSLQALLHYLSVWEAFGDIGHHFAYGTAAAWGSEQLMRNDYLFTGLGMGWHLDRNAFDRMLALGVSQAGATLLTGARLKGCSRDGFARWRIEARQSDGTVTEITAGFLIEATGRSAAVARHLGGKAHFCRSLGWSYRICGIG